MSILRDAFIATAEKRGTLMQMKDVVSALDEIEQSPVMERFWESYQKKYPYAADFSWHIVMGSVKSLYLEIDNV